MPCVTDWAATGSMLSGIGTIGGVVAVIAAAHKAADTFRQFKRERITERKIEQAERILVATYKAQYAIDYIRGRILWSHEIKKAEQALRETKQITGGSEQKDRQKISAQVYIDRLNTTNKDQEKLIELLPIARALWGVELEKDLHSLYGQFWMIHTIVSESVENEDRQRAVELRRLLNGQSATGEDEISKEIRRATRAIEVECRPALEADEGRGI